MDIPVDFKMLHPDFQAVKEFNAKYRKGPGYEQACKGLVNHIALFFSIHNPYGCMQHDEYADLEQEPRPDQAFQISDHNVKSEPYSSMWVDPLTPEDVVRNLAAAMDGLSAQYPLETASEPCEMTFSFAP